MAPADALAHFLPRYEAFESKVDRALEKQDADIDSLQETVAVLLKENELTRKSLDRFTNAILVGSLSIVGAAAAVILFGPGA